MKKNKKVIIGTLLVITILILSSTILYIKFNQQKETNGRSNKQKEIDDRISPLIEQAIYIEIKRIRAKGIIKQMTDTGPLVEKINELEINDRGFIPLICKISGKPVNGLGLARFIRGMLPGKGWDETPRFTFGSVIDDFSWVAEKKEFNSWDTGYIFNEFYKVVEEEKQTSKVQIQVIEKKQQKNLFGTETKQEIAEKINLEYDYKTGRWDGDDYFNDSDGYGHYNGTDYEIWFDLRQSDKDGDKIPYWTEVNILGTDPRVDDRKLDPDGDKCSTAWEWMWGYDPFKWDNHSEIDPDNDGIQNTEEEYMSKWLANPYQPEIYIESDYSDDAPDETLIGDYKITMKKGKIIPIRRPVIEKALLKGQEYTFWEESQQMLMERFNEHGITLHVDDGCIGEGGEKLDYIGLDGVAATDYSISEYYKKDFSDERKGIFRYLIICHGGGYIYNMDYRGQYDTIVVQQSDQFYKGPGGNAITPRAQRVAQAVSILHELGHSCGYGYFHCGGVDNLSAEGSAEKWYNYKSVMNYLYYGCRYFDFSDGTHGPNDCNDWAKIDVGFFQRSPEEYDLEGIDLDLTKPPFNR